MGKPFELVVPDTVEDVSISLPDGLVFNWNAGKGFNIITAEKTKLVVSDTEFHVTRVAAKPAASTEAASAGKGTGKRKYTRKNKGSKKKNTGKAPASPAYAQEVEAEGVLDLGKPGRGRTFAIKAFKKNNIVTVEDLFRRKKSINKFKGLGKQGKQLIAAALDKFIAANPRVVKK